MSCSLRSMMAVTALATALAAPASAAPARSEKTHSVVGTLQKVDGRAITVKTPKGTEVVMLISRSRIQRGASTLEPTALGSYAGIRVKVRYLENNGEKEAQTVTLASATKPAAPAQEVPSRGVAANVATTTTATPRK
jgi:hypothetical protein